MSGSFLMSTDILFDGSLETGIVLDSEELKKALHQIRETYFRHRALYRGMNGDAFGDRLRKPVNDRCGDYEQFAHDLGISLSYLHSLLEEPFAVSNPSVRLLKRMGMRLGERVGYLIGDQKRPTRSSLASAKDTSEMHRVNPDHIGDPIYRQVVRKRLVEQFDCLDEP